MAILETIVAIVFIYAVLSLIATSVKELLENAAQKRKRDMRGAILELLGEEAGKALFQSDIISAISGQPSGTADPDNHRQWPSYIEDETFARAVSALLGDARFQQQWDSSPLQKSVAALTARGHAVTDAIESIYRQRMDRLQGSFKRNAQCWLFGIGLVLAITLDADTVHLIKGLRSDAALRATVVAIAADNASPDAVAKLCPVSTGAGDHDKMGKIKAAGQAPEPVDEAAAAPAPRQTLSDITHCVDSALPGVLGWSATRRADLDKDAWNYVLALCGYFMTAAAVSLGAPFWFDLLGKVSNLRATMKPKP